MLKGMSPGNRFARQAARKEWLKRLDRVAGDVNVLLLVFAIGLATVDLTFLFSQSVIDRLPTVTRVVTVDQDSTKAQ